MRTVTLLGLTAIADAIDKTWLNKELIMPLAIVLIVAVVMDIAEFLHKVKS